VFENRVLRRKCRPKKEEVEGGWRRLDNEKLHNLYASPNIIMVMEPRRIRWTGACTTHGRGGKYLQNFSW